jgi:hypothetical protein
VEEKDVSHAFRHRRRFFSCLGRRRQCCRAHHPDHRPVDGVTAGGRFFTHYQNIFVANTSLSFVSLTGNAAVAEAEAGAYGSNTLTKTSTGTLTTSGSSASGSFSSSATD